MANQKQLEQLEQIAGAIISTPISELVSNPAKWGSLHFEAARADLEILFGIAHQLAELPFQILPEPVATQIISYLTQAAATTEQIRTFAIETATNPSQQRDQIVGTVKDSTTNLLSSTASWIPFLAYQKGDVQKNIESMASAAVQINKALADAKANIVTKEAELDKIVDAAREASAVAGVGVFTSDFTERANALELEAKVWLKWTGAAAIATIIVAVAAMFIHVGDTPSEIAQFLTSKILALVVLISATVWCGRIYKATKHQAATNRHRALSLKTFQAFTQAAKDDATRNAVLLESTRSIFAMAPSGYLDSVESSDSGTKVLEVIKGINGRGAAE